MMNFTRRLLSGLALLPGLLLCIPARAGEPAPPPLRVLVYGDSNTWGWRPISAGPPAPRYADSQRWAGVMQGALGEGYVVEVNGLIARTLNVDQTEGVGALTGQDHNGMRRLDLALMQASPVHLLVVMLGTNDMIDELHRTPAQIAKGLATLAAKAKAGTAAHDGSTHPRLLFVIPPPLGDASQGPFKALFGPRALEKSRQLAGAMKKEALRLGVAAFDAGSVVSTDGVDGVHLTEEGHRRLGAAVAAEVVKLVAH